jgi:anti-sigma factor RsiW
MIDEADDARLVALIDDQLDDSARQALQTRLMVEPDLRARYHQLTAGGLPFHAAFKTALAEAPVARMRARFDVIDGAPPARRPRLGVIAAALAAIALFLVGWAVGHYLPAPGPLAPNVAEDRDDWRQAVASYVSLYTPQTFVGVTPDIARALSRLSHGLGIALTPDALALPNLTINWADVLAYDGAPLGQIVYQDGGNPIVFCIINNGHEDAPIETEMRAGVTIASWAHGGHSFLVGGHLPKARAIQLAGTLAARF